MKRRGFLAALIGAPVAGALKAASKTEVSELKPTGRKLPGHYEWSWKSPHIHAPGDGRGPRMVYVDDVLIENCCYADTKRGYVEFFSTPLRLNSSGTEAVRESRYGRVRVEAIR